MVSTLNVEFTMRLLSKDFFLGIVLIFVLLVPQQLLTTSFLFVALFFKLLFFLLLLVTRQLLCFARFSFLLLLGDSRFFLHLAFLVCILFLLSLGGLLSF